MLDTLEAGAHVIVEKPIALGFEEYAELRDAAAAPRPADHRELQLPLHAGGHAARSSWPRSGAASAGPVNLDVTLGVPFSAPGGSYMDSDLPHFAHELPGGALHNFVSHPASFVAAFLGPPERVAVSRRRLTRGLSR